MADTDELPLEKRAAIASIEQTKSGIKVSTYDRVRALELLGKHLGMFDGKGGQEKNLDNNLLDAIKSSTKEAADGIPEIQPQAAHDPELVE